MLKSNKTKLVLFVSLLLLFLGVSFVFAQKPLEINYPDIPGVETPTTTKTALPAYIRYIFQFSLSLAALITLISFFYGGVRYLTSGGSAFAQKEAKSQISAGVLGLIILLASYIALNTINPQLVGSRISLPGRIEVDEELTVGPPESRPASYVEIPLGGLIENLWGERKASPHKPADCYWFDENGNATKFLKNQERLDCIKWLAKAIQVKAKKLKEPIEELQKLYDCQNCCRNCCEICNWDEEEGWQNCGSYACCEGGKWVHQYYYQECPFNCCEYFLTCQCTECKGCICVRPPGEEEEEEEEPIPEPPTLPSLVQGPAPPSPPPPEPPPPEPPGPEPPGPEPPEPPPPGPPGPGEAKGECCNPEDPSRPYEDVLVRGLIDKIEPDPYPEINAIKPALKELKLKLGLFPLTEELMRWENLNELLDGHPETQNLIKEILIGQPAEEEKLKQVLKIKSVMQHLIEGGWLLEDRNIAKTMMINLGLLRNEIAINEIAWMGTETDPANEWIELYNNTKEGINLTDWKLVVKDKFEINLSGTIPSQGFLLLSNQEGIGANLIYDGILADSGEVLELYDEFGNLVEEVDCEPGWFTGDKDSKASMERINSRGETSRDNWAVCLSSGGTPKSPNSQGVFIISYPSFSSLIAELSNKLANQETLREKLILVLRQEENLERIVKSKDFLEEILTGDEWRFKDLLRQREVLQILLEDKENLTLLLTDEHAKEVIKNILVRTGNWSEEEEEEKQWQEFLAGLDETLTNLKLINDFQRDLLWVLNARDLMRGCESSPISYDQFRTPGLSPRTIERVPEWEDIKREVLMTDPKTGQLIDGFDPSIFYCHKQLW